MAGNSARKLHGFLCVISSPSGGGKTSVIQAVLQRNPNFAYSVSATTRPRRPHETNGVDYFFLTDSEFDCKLLQEEFIEWAEVHTYRYGTLKQPIEELLSKSKTVLLDIDVIGGTNVRKNFPQQSLLIFLLPPSLEELKRRLQGRKSENLEQIRSRLERLPMEMSFANDYDVQIMNKDFIRTVEQVESAIKEALSKNGGTPT